MENVFEKKLRAFDRPTSCYVCGCARGVAPKIYGAPNFYDGRVAARNKPLTKNGVGYPGDLFVLNIFHEIYPVCIDSWSHLLSIHAEVKSAPLRTIENVPPETFFHSSLISVSKLAFCSHCSLDFDGPVYFTARSVRYHANLVAFIATAATPLGSAEFWRRAMQRHLAALNSARRHAAPLAGAWWRAMQRPLAALNSGGAQCNALAALTAGGAPCNALAALNSGGAQCNATWRR